MDNILFRCSSLYGLMGEAKGNITDIQLRKLAELKAKQKRTEKQTEEMYSLEGKRRNPKLSEGLKTLTEDLFLLKEYGYKETVQTDEMYKGHLCEAESRILVHKVLGGEPRIRFGENLKNDFITGTPDIVLQNEDYVEDIKNSFTLRTFFKVKEINPSYYWQAQGYMWLTGKTKYRLIYTLNPDPFEIENEKIKRIWWKYGGDDNNQDFLNHESEIQRNNEIIRNLKDEERIKVFEFDYNPEDIEKLKGKIELARKYYSTLKLN